MNRVYTYTIVLHDGTHYEEDTYHLESGLLMAETYTNAVEQLEEYYRPNLTRIVDLAETYEEMIILPASVVYDYARGEYAETEIPCNKWGNKLTESDDETTKIDWNVSTPEGI